jgi:hypothetical protein
VAERSARAAVGLCVDSIWCFFRGSGADVLVQHPGGDEVMLEEAGESTWGDILDKADSLT